METLLLASVTSRNIAGLRARWRAEGGFANVPGQRFFNSSQGAAGTPVSRPLEPRTAWPKANYQLPENPTSLAPVFSDTSSFSGQLVVLSWPAGEVIWQSAWPQVLATPHGFCFVGDRIFVNDLEGCFVYEIASDPFGQLIRRISNQSFNDIHSIRPTSKGLLITSCGGDCIIEIDFSGRTIWEWWAVEHGFEITPSGLLRESGRGQELRTYTFHTSFQTTHVNCAEAYGPGDRYILASLFHCGLVVRIDRSARSSERAEVVAAGLARPHGPIKIDGGFLICNSLGQEVIEVDEELSTVRRIPYRGGWIQDATKLQDGSILVNDVDNHVLVQLDYPSGELVRAVKYEESWRLAEARVLPATLARGLVKSIAL